MVAEFYRQATSNLTSESVGLSTQRYVSNLPLDEQLEIARAIVGDPDDRFVLFGISLLIEFHHEDEAVPAVAERIIRGTDIISSLYWAWLHEGDPSLAQRMSLKISRYLFNRFDQLKEDEQKRVLLFICTYGLEPPLHEDECSRQVVHERLSRED